MALRYALLVSACSLYTAAVVPVVAAADLAPPSAYEGQKVINVRFDPPGQPVESDALNGLLTWKPGGAFHLTDVRAAIKRLYATGAFASVDVSADPTPGGVEVVIRTTEQWFIGPIEARSKITLPPSEGQLADATRLELGEPFRDDDIDRATNGMRRLLERNGFYNAKITPAIQRDPIHQDVSITFEVDSGKRARLTAPVVTGDTRLSADDVARAAKYKGWFRWKPATDATVQGGIYNILNKYASKDRLTADVTLQKREYLASTNQVRPNIQANGGPVVKITAAEAKISRGKLKTYIPVFEEKTVNNDLLVNGARNLRDYFQFQGYFDVQVDFATAAPSKDLETITYTIGLGERHRVVSVTITGNKYLKTADLRAYLYTEPAGFIRLRRGRYSQSFAKRDSDAIAAVYKNNGFRDVKVIPSTQDDYKGKKGDVAVTFTINEGRQYLVSSMRVDGLSLPNAGSLLTQLASSLGQPYSETSIASDRDFLLSACQADGYASATFAFRAEPVPAEPKMAVAYTVVLGPRQTVREVVITGMNATRMRLVKPALKIKAGDPLSMDAMGATQRELYNLGVFDKVDMAIQDPDGDLTDKYALFHLTEGHRYYTAIGVGAQVARFGGSETSLDSAGGDHRLCS